MKYLLPEEINQQILNLDVNLLQNSEVPLELKIYIIGVFQKHVFNTSFNNSLSEKWSNLSQIMTEFVHIQDDEHIRLGAMFFTTIAMFSSEDELLSQIIQYFHELTIEISIEARCEIMKLYLEFSRIEDHADLLEPLPEMLQVLSENNFVDVIGHYFKIDPNLPNETKVNILKICFNKLTEENFSRGSFILSLISGSITHVQCIQDYIFENLSEILEFLMGLISDSNKFELLSEDIRYLINSIYSIAIENNQDEDFVAQLKSIVESKDNAIITSFLIAFIPLYKEDTSLIEICLQCIASDGPYIQNNGIVALTRYAKSYKRFISEQYYPIIFQTLFQSFIQTENYDIAKLMYMLIKQSGVTDYTQDFLDLYNQTENIYFLLSMETSTNDMNDSEFRDYIELILQSMLKDINQKLVETALSSLVFSLSKRDISENEEILGMLNQFAERVFEDFDFMIIFNDFPDFLRLCCIPAEKVPELIDHVISKSPTPDIIFYDGNINDSEDYISFNYKNRSAYISKVDLRIYQKVLNSLSSILEVYKECLDNEAYFKIYEYCFGLFHEYNYTLSKMYELVYMCLSEIFTQNRAIETAEIYIPRLVEVDCSLDDFAETRVNLLIALSNIDELYDNPETMRNFFELLKHDISQLLNLKYGYLKAKLSTTEAEEDCECKYFYDYMTILGKLLETDLAEECLEYSASEGIVFPPENVMFRSFNVLTVTFWSHVCSHFENYFNLVPQLVNYTTQCIREGLTQEKIAYINCLTIVILAHNIETIVPRYLNLFIDMAIKDSEFADTVLPCASLIINHFYSARIVNKYMKYLLELFDEFTICNEFRDLVLRISEDLPNNPELKINSEKLVQVQNYFASQESEEEDGE